MINLGCPSSYIAAGLYGDTYQMVFNLFSILTTSMVQFHYSINSAPLKTSRLFISCNSFNQWSLFCPIPSYKGNGLLSLISDECYIVSPWYNNNLNLVFFLLKWNLVCLIISTLQIANMYKSVEKIYYYFISVSIFQHCTMYNERTVSG